MCSVRRAVKEVFLLQGVMMDEISPLLFKGYILQRRNGCVSASPSVCTVCIVLFSIIWTGVTLSATAGTRREPGGLVYSSGGDFMLHRPRT